MQILQTDIIHISFIIGVYLDTTTCELALKYTGVIQLLFSIGHLYLIGVWFDEDQITNTIRTLILNEIELSVHIV